MKRVNTGEILKPWVWRSEMDFYLPFLPSSSQPEIVYEEMGNSDYEYLNSDTNMTGEIERDSYIISEPIESVLIVGDPPETTEVEENSPFDIIKRRSQKRKNVSQEPQTSLQDHFRKKKLNVLFDDMDCLLLAHAKTIKTFSRKRQAVIKYKIAQVIMEQELLHFQEQKELTNRNKWQRI